MANVYGTNTSEVINPCSRRQPRHQFRSRPTAATTRSSASGGDDDINGGTGADAIDGGTGSDTAFYSDSTVGVSVSLLDRDRVRRRRAGRHARQHREPHRLVLRRPADRRRRQQHAERPGRQRHAQGRRRSRHIVGLNGNDVAARRRRRRHLNGGGGNDTVTYSDSPAAVFVSFDPGRWAAATPRATASRIENVIGSRFYGGRLVQGSTATMAIRVCANDALGERQRHLGGRGGADCLHGGNGNDLLFARTASTPCTARPATTASTAVPAPTRCAAR